MRRLERPLAIVICVCALLVCAYALQLTWQAFLTGCPNKDVLHWDGNVRTAMVLDRYQHLLDGNVFEVLASHLRANTWPPLRSAIALLLFAITGPDLILDVGISFAFFALLLVAILVAAVRMTGSFLLGSVAFLATAVVILHTQELNAYALASMLETQGMFFVVLSLFFLYHLYNSFGNSLGAMSSALPPEGPPKLQESRPLSERAILIGLFVSVQGLVFTKYPYAIMLFMSVVLFELIRAPLTWFEIGRSLLETHYRGWRRLLIVAFVLVVLGLLVAGRIGYLGVNTKVTKRLIYLVCVLIFVDFNVFVFRSKEQARALFPKSIQLFYLAGVLPALAWIFSNPDRFSSVLGGQFWVGTTKLRATLFETLGYLFMPAWPALVLFGLGLGAIGVLYWLTGRPAKGAPGRRGTWQERLSECIELPVVATLLICWLMYVAQDLFNPNKQDRHVYHIVPGLLLSSVATFLFMARRIGESRGAWFTGIGAALVLCLGVVPLFGTTGLAGGAYVKGRYFCYTDVDHKIFAEARWVAAQLEPGKRYVAINYFHAVPFNAEKRNQASEIDVLLRTQAIRNGGRLFSDHRYHLESWRGFDYLLLVAPDCAEAGASGLVKRRSQATRARLKPLWKRTYPAGGVCVEQWSL